MADRQIFGWVFRSDAKDNFRETGDCAYYYLDEIRSLQPYIFTEGLYEILTCWGSWRFVRIKDLAKILFPKNKK